jgi:hypothetical protein
MAGLDYQFIQICVNILQSVVSLITLITILFFAQQTFEMIKQTRVNSATLVAQVYEQIASSMTQLDCVFIEHPEYRKFFYDSYPFEKVKNKNEEAAVLSVAEMFFDFMDLLFVLEKMSSDSGARNEVELPLVEWNTYFKDIYGTSPAMQHFLMHHKNWYHEELIDYLINPDSPKIEKKSNRRTLPKLIPY